MSLSYLKPEVEEDKKSPKPENLAALREALLSVMNGGGDTAPQRQEPVQQNHAPAPTQQVQPQQAVRYQSDATHTEQRDRESSPNHAPATHHAPMHTPSHPPVQKQEQTHAQPVQQKVNHGHTEQAHQPVQNQHRPAQAPHQQNHAVHPNHEQKQGSAHVNSNGGNTGGHRNTPGQGAPAEHKPVQNTAANVKEVTEDVLKDLFAE
jgi:hypothetical protein